MRRGIPGVHLARNGCSPSRNPCSPSTGIGVHVGPESAPLLSQFDETPPIEVLRQALQIVITVWNAHVLAMPEWGQAEHLESLAKLNDSLRASGSIALVDVLTKRRNERFKNDSRAIGEWTIEPTADGFRFRCDARQPGPETALGDPHDECPSVWHGR